MRLIIILIVPLMAFGMDPNNNNTEWAAALQKPTSSPQERLANLTIKQKIAQLFMPGMQLNDPDDFEKVTDLIKRYPIGGVLLTHPNTSDMAVLYIQHLHESNAAQGHPLPLWIAMDAEWGLSMRLTDAVVFPKALSLAATDNKDLINECAQEIGRQLEQLGVHINFAPVVDVNNNRNNPVIGIRSFGENPEEVIACAKAYMNGLRKNNIIYVPKHYPGHGNTNVDSHLALPVINFTLEQLHEIELKPFEAFIKMGIPMIMVAHLLIPALDETLPTSLSPKVIEELLRKKMGYQGLVITDGLKMKAVSDQYKSAELALLAFKAGNDIILQLDDTEAGIEALIAAYHRGEIAQQQIDERVTRIWSAKNKQGLLEKEDQCPPDYAQAFFHTEYAYDLQRRLYEAAMTLVNNDNRMLPIPNSMIKETLLIDIGGANYFAQELEQQGIAVKRLSRIFDRDEVVKNQWKDFNNIIISIAGMSKFAGQSYEISEDAQYLCGYVQGLKNLHTNSVAINENSVPQDIKEVVQKENEKVGTIYESPKRTMLVLFGLPYAASLVAHQGLLIAYEDGQEAQRAAANVVLGKHHPTGKLPVSIDIRYPAGTGTSF